MAKRVSLKGKGANIFFEGYPVEPPAVSTDDAAPEHTATVPELPAIVETDHPAPPAGKLVRMQESKHASTTGPPVMEPPLATLLPAEVIDAIEDRVADRATITNAFRYTQAELATLTDALYAINKRQRAKLSKQDVARFGLNAILWDYEVRGEASLLAELARRKNRR